MTTNTSWVPRGNQDMNMFKGKDDLTGAQTIQRQDKNERLQIPDLDMKMLDMIMQEGSEGRH